MKNRVIGALAAGVCVVLVASACTVKERSFDGENVGGMSASAGNTHVPPSGGSQASAGTAGDTQTLGGSTAGGSGGQAGACPSDGCLDCEGATPAAGTPCGECGTNVCNPDLTTTSCSDPHFNACGGCAKLAGEPGAACGECGKYECATDKESVTCNDPGKNACGGCGVLAMAPGASCGACGDWQCTADKTNVACSGVNANACGGCGTLANAPGATCGECGKYECSADKSKTTCNDPGKNLCNGCGVLAAAPNSACGSGNCGKQVCSSDKSSVSCSAANPNACGGCNTLTPSGATKDGSCGSCSQKWACNADKNSLSCAGTAANACGGCTTLSGSVGASCGSCMVTACASDKNSLTCKSQCTGSQVCVSGLNQCKAPDCSAANSCGQSDGAGGICTNSSGKCSTKPNTSVQCSGSNCAYTCKADFPVIARGLSCSSAADPWCGNWDFESSSAERWAFASGSDAQVGGFTYATPPGSGAGKKSLAIKVDGSRGDLLSLVVNFCPGGIVATGLQGVFHISAWFAPTDGSTGLAGPGYTYLGNAVFGPDVNCPAGQWFDIPSNPISGTNVSQAVVSIAGITGHTGTVYFDNAYFD